MKYFLIFFFFLPLSIYAQDFWISTIHGKEFTGSTSRTLVCDNNDDLITVGTVGLPAHFGEYTIEGAEHAQYFAKYANSGELLTAKLFPDSLSDVWDIKIGEDNDLYVCGRMYTQETGADIFVGRYDHDLNNIWFKKTTGNDAIGAMLALSDEHLYLSGYVKGEECSFDDFLVSGPNKMFTAKIDLNGEVLWVNQDYTLPAAPNTIAANVSGDLYATTSYLSEGDTAILCVSKVNSNGELIWERKLRSVDPFNNKGLGDGGRLTGLSINGNEIIIGGVFINLLLADSIISSGERIDYFIASLDPDGNFNWFRHDLSASFFLGGHPGKIISTSDQEIVTIAKYSSDLFINGDIAFDQYGGCGFNTYLTVRDRLGHLQSLYVLSGSNTSKCGYYGGICFDSQGSIYFSGRYSDVTRIGNLDLTAEGWTDVFVAKFDPEMEWLYHQEFEPKITGLTVGKKNLIKIYPNPANDYILISLAQENIDVKAIRITDVSGKIVTSKSVTESTDLLRLPTRGLSEGIYFLQITTDADIISKTFVKQ